MNEITPSIQNVIVVESEHQQIASEAFTYSQEKLKQELFFKAHNRKHKDGRIYSHIDTNGQKVAMSVSPKFEGFESQVEAGIFPAVNALKEKGYFTISSCEGHPYGALIKVGFGTHQCREDFITSINAAEIPHVSFRRHGLCVNTRAVINENTASVVKKERNEKEGNFDYWEKEQAKNFNMQFDTHFDKWFMLDVYVLQPSPMWKIFKKIRETLDVGKKDKYLSQLTECFHQMENYQEVYSKNFLEQIGRAHV